MSEEEIKILLIEDDKFQSRLISTLLQRNNSQRVAVYPVFTLSDAIKSLETGNIDVIILDLTLPDSQDIETFTSVSKHAKDIPILVLTGMEDERIAVETMRRGAQDYILKMDLNANQLQKAITKAMEKKVLLDKLAHVSQSDKLTGLYNKEAFVTLSNHHIKLASRRGDTMMLLFMDFNQLKNLKKKLGEEEAERAIIDLSRLLKSTFRDKDIIARISNDEFIILLTDISEEYNADIIDRVKKKLVDFNRKGFRKYKLALTIGSIAFDPSEQNQIDELINKESNKIQKIDNV